MPIAIEDGFFQSHDLSHVSCLGIETNRLEECVERIKTRKVFGVFGSPDFRFNGNDLDFLVDLPWIETVWFTDVNLKNIDGLYNLSNLKHFGIFPKRPPIDFSRFSKLRRAVIELKPKDRGFETLNELELFHLWHFRSKDSTFASLVFPESLVELQINWANPSSLRSLPAIPGLKRLEIHRCRNLDDLGDLGEKFPNLEHLVVDACGRVTLVAGERAVRNLPKLLFAYVQSAKLV